MDETRMILEIHPYLGIGALRLGSPAEDVRRIIGTSFTTLQKPAGLWAEAFDGLGIDAHYDARGLCQALEVFSPTVPVFMGRELIDRSYNELKSWLELLDPELQVADSHLTSLELGFRISAPAARRQKDALAESVTVFARGYYV